MHISVPTCASTTQLKYVTTNALTFQSLCKDELHTNTQFSVLVVAAVLCFLVKKKQMHQCSLNLHHPTAES